MRTVKNTGFLDHPGVKLDLDVDKNIYYSRYAEVNTITRIIARHQANLKMSLSLGDVSVPDAVQRVPVRRSRLQLQGPEPGAPGLGTAL